MAGYREDAGGQPTPFARQWKRQLHREGVLMRNASLVLNPTTVYDRKAIVDLVRRRCLAAGWDQVTVRHTTPGDAGTTATRAAVEEGAELVLCCGGDGTLAAAAAGLAHTGVPLAILSTGSGNLLSRNLNVPLDLESGLDVALDSHTTTIDVGRVDGNTFVVMAGIGFDAAIMAEASGRLKERLGWLAYFVAGLKRIRTGPMSVEIGLDARDSIARGKVLTVIVGNVGDLQGGLAVLPEADPADGVLDVAVVAPRTFTDWLRAGWRILRRQPGSDSRLQHFRAKQIRIRATRAQARQFDGEVMEPGRSLDIRIDPAALIVKVPR